MTNIEKAIFELKDIKAVGKTTAKIMGISDEKYENDAAWIDFTIGVLQREQETAPCGVCGNALYCPECGHELNCKERENE